MKLPRREWFNYEELAVEWGISVKDIEHLVETNKLTSSTRYQEVFGEPYWKDILPGDKELARIKKRGSMPVDYDPDFDEYRELAMLDHMEWGLIRLSEVERFEAVHGMKNSASDETVSNKQNATETDNPKVKGTLLKLVAAMAIKGYSYKPTEAKSTIPSEIARDAEELGLSIDEKTVRKWLKEAVSQIDQDKLL